MIVRQNTAKPFYSAIFAPIQQRGSLAGSGSGALRKGHKVVLSPLKSRGQRRFPRLIGDQRLYVIGDIHGMLHPLREAAPDTQFIAANEAAHCRFMKMITLPKLRDSLRDAVHEVRVPRETADRARLPIERMVAIS